MKSELLKMNGPYNVIYAGGKVGRHIATLLTWQENEDGLGLATADSYPVIDMGEEYPAGTLCDTPLEDCRNLCAHNGTNLHWLSKIIEYDTNQIEPAGVEYILNRMKLLDCFVALPRQKNKEGEEVTVIDYQALLYVTCIDGKTGDKDAIYEVRTSPRVGFYFYAVGTESEIEYELDNQRRSYEDFFMDYAVRITLVTDLDELPEMVKRLNENR